MSAKNYRGCSTLDMARSFISEFMKLRCRDVPYKLYDKYYVITSETFPKCIKQLSREVALNEQLKNLRAVGSQSYVDTLYNAFHFITLERNASRIENYGYGRCPFYSDHFILISLSDSKSADDVPSTVKLDSRVRGDLTKEAYRWDQKLFSVVFRMGAECKPWAPGDRVEPDSPNIERIANIVGGCSFRINCHREIYPCIESILLRIQIPGVNVKFVCPTIQNLQINGEPENLEVKLKKKLELYPLTKVNVRFADGKPIMLHWPIPESYWLKRIETNVPLRSAYPIVYFAQTPVSTQLLTDFPFDKYELEPSPLVDYVLERFRGSTDEKKCLQVFVHNSGKSDGFGKPFGFIKIMSNGSGANLFIMPYNYPVLCQLLQELKNEPSIKTNADWKRRLETYLDSVPLYYHSNLKKHLLKLSLTGISQLEEHRQGYRQEVVNNITSLYNQAKEERDRNLRIINAVAPHWLAHQWTAIEVREIYQVAGFYKKAVEALNTSRLTKKEKKDRRPSKAIEVLVEEEFFADPEDLVERRDRAQKTDFKVHFAENRIKPPIIESTFKNPLLLKKENLVKQLPKMRANLNLFLTDSSIPMLDGGPPGVSMNLRSASEIHRLPVQQMGNYEEYIKMKNKIGGGPLREIEPKPVRLNAFGNPFKMDKKNLAIDEVGQDPADSNTAPQKESRKSKKGRPPRRKTGPLAVNSLGVWRERRKTCSLNQSVSPVPPFSPDYRFV